MSADNWTYCPMCKHNTEKRRLTLEKECKDKYGKVSLKEYQILQMKLKNVKNSDQDTSLREDYEIGIFEGDLIIDYKASCSVCDFKFHFKEIKSLNIA